MFGSWGKGGPPASSSKAGGTSSRPAGKPSSQQSGKQAAEAAQPLRLLYCDEAGRFVVEPAAIKALAAVKGPVGVVAVCGRARQGKSFILNQLLGRTSGFAVAPTHRPCTKGLWMWSQPVARTAADGSAYHLVLLDSEGIDAYDQTGTYSVQIFSLAVLLSSMFVYNQMGGIDEAALDRLSLVTEMTHHIRVKAAGQGVTDPAELAPFSPAFLWLLRDFYLDLSEDNRPITPRDYLERALQPTQGSSKAVQSKNQIRESIRSLFPRRDCFTLVRPVHDEAQLQRLDALTPDAMRPEFRAGLEQLTALIFERTRPKQMEGVTLTGPMLTALAQSFVGAINQGAVPTIATSWQSVAEGECRRAYDSALAAYASSFDRSTPPEEGPLVAAHSAAVEAALVVFSREAVGSAELRQPFESKLKTELAKQFQEYRGRVLVEAEVACTRALDALDARLSSAAAAPGASLEQLLAVLEGALKAYDAAAGGPGKASMLVAYLQKSLASGPLHQVVEKERLASSSTVKDLQAQLAAAIAARDAAEREAATSSKVADEWRRQRDAEVSARQEAEVRGQAAVERAQQEAWQREERAASGHQQTLASKESELRAVAAQSRQREEETGSLKERVKWLEAGVRRVEGAAASAQRSTAEAVRSAEGQMAQLLADKAAVEQERHVAQSALAAVREERARLEQTLRSLEKDKARLQAEKQDAQEMLAVSEASERDAQRRLAEMKADMEKLAEKGQGAQRQAARAAQAEQRLQESRDAVSRLEAAEVQLRAEVAALRGEKTTHEAAQQELTAARQRVAALEKEVQGLTRERDALDARIARHREEAASVRLQANGADAGGAGDMEVEHETPTHPRKRARNEADASAAERVAPAKKTIAQLKQELTEAGYAAEILAVKNISKKDLVKLYEEKGVGEG